MDYSLSSESMCYNLLIKMKTLSKEFLLKDKSIEDKFNIQTKISKICDFMKSFVFNNEKINTMFRTHMNIIYMTYGRIKYTEEDNKSIEKIIEILDVWLQHIS